MTKLPEDFDCLEMKKQIQVKIYTEIKDMTTEERIAYFHIPPEKDPFRGKMKITQPIVTSPTRATFRKKKELV